jgi:hypothetical protein
MEFLGRSMLGELDGSANVLQTQRWKGSDDVLRAISISKAREDGAQGDPRAANSPLPGAMLPISNDARRIVGIEHDAFPELRREIPSR